MQLVKFQMHGKYISIDHTYIMISDIPRAHIDFNSSASIAKHIVGFDRCDGVNYYKSYRDPLIVKKITLLIEQHDIYATDPKGNRIESVDE